MRYSLAILLLGVSPAFATNYVQEKFVDHQQFNDVIIEQKVVNFDDRYYYGVNGYYDVANNIRERQAIELRRQDTERVRSLELQLETLIQLMKQNQGQQILADPKIDRPEPLNEEAKFRKEDINEEELGDNLDAKVFGIFKNKCSACHGPNSDYSPELIGKDELGEYLPSSQLSLEDRISIYDRTKGVHLEERGLARMPKGDEPLTDDEVDALFLYLMRVAE